jgi:short-subunit dehydrogenase
MDVTKADSIGAAKAEIDRVTKGHGVDVLVNNAGYGLVGPLEEISDADLRKQYDTNVFGLMAVTRAFLPAMRSHGFGRVINLSSMGGRMTFPMMGAYNSTKYAVESLSDALRVEVKPFGIGVSLIEPGAIRTEFADVAMGTVQANESSPYAAVLAEKDQMAKMFDATAVGPATVVRAIQRAALSRRPAARYVAPFQTNFALWMVRLLPTSWVDAVMGWATGLTKKKLSAARPSLPAARAAAV